MQNIQCEITPLGDEDLFVILNNPKAKFDYPIHYHSDYELNLVLNISGKRIVGDSIENFENGDLVLLGPGLPHVWKAPTLESTLVITIQFHESMYDSFLLKKRLFEPVRELLDRSKRGIVYSGEIFDSIKNKMIALSHSSGFSTVFDFYNILYDLSTSKGQRLLASASYDSSLLIRESRSRRIEKVCKYITDNFKSDIKVSDAAELINMSESCFSHFFKKRTSRSFITFLTDIRIGYATKLLSETTRSIADIAYDSGFANISNFNRIFKKYKNQTPKEYRASVFNTITKY